MNQEINHKNLNNRKQRVLFVIDNEFKSAADFCREADLSHNWVNYFKSAEEPKINDQLLSTFYDLRKINPLWIIKNIEPYKLIDDEKEPIQNPESGSDLDPNLLHAFTLLERIEQKSDALKDMKLPEDIALRLAQLLVRVLERQKE